MADATKLDAIVDQIAELSVLELSELVKALEDKFGVTAAAPMMMGAMMPMAGAGEAAVDEGPSSFDVMLNDSGSQKIQVIKEVRALTGLGLKEAKALVDGVPAAIKEDCDEAEANDIKAKLEAIGAVIELKGRA